MNTLRPPDSFDHSSDLAFLAYYAEQSASPATLGRFSRIRDKSLKLIAARRLDSLHMKDLMVLDIGCGAGTQARLWAELGHRVFGLDVNQPLVELGRKRAIEQGLAIQFEVGTATKLPYADTSMDVCLMPELLEHVEDWQSCLSEAVRVLKPGGMLYLSTSNALCPKQQEFNLPLYSWYPGFLKRHFERLAVTTRPDLANHARYPAVHWFTFYGLRRHLGRMGMQCLDRFDLIDTTSKTFVEKALVSATLHFAPLRFAGHVMTSGTSVFGFKQTS